MYTKGMIASFYALTTLHPGSGNSLSYVDLPVQREKHTSFPVIVGSSVKGVIREYASRKWNNDEKVASLFGNEDNGDIASKISFTDARILLYPVRSVRGIFSYVTCPYVLKRFLNDIEVLANITDNFKNTISSLNISDDRIMIDKDLSELKIENNLVGIEEFLFSIDPENKIRIIIEELEKYLSIDKKDLGSRLSIVSDSVFTDLVNYAIEVRTRNKIDQTKGTAEDKALFVVELIPSEAVFYSLILLKKEKESSMEEIKVLLDSQVIQVGGDETIGNGLVRVKIQV